MDYDEVVQICLLLWSKGDHCVSVVNTGYLRFRLFLCFWFIVHLLQQLMNKAGLSYFEEINEVLGMIYDHIVYQETIVYIFVCVCACT